jgi:7-cyano-7-deazaguanine synthase
MGDAPPTADTSRPLAVLASGGADSAILVGESAGLHPAVHPIYVRFGLVWEDVELAFLRRFLAALPSPALRPLVVLDLPVADLYGEHWSLTGVGVPAAGSPDEDVFLPGRNSLLLVKAILWCHLHDVPAVATGSLLCNPFPDGTLSFYRHFAAAVNEGVEGDVKVVAPYRGLTKTEVLLRGRGMPLEWTFSCLRPVEGRHCGTCNKCHERQAGFRDAGMADPTAYERSVPCSA